jgi:FkbM family methyltransferase
MTMVSYAQNFEDVILQRALRWVATGCYLDVGASLPDKDSVSYAFYRRGWRGICVEPLAYSEAWNQLRPQDIFINAAVGANLGEATLHIFDNVREISTASPDSAEHWGRFGFRPTQKVTVPVTTINEILARYLNGRTLNFVSIDVEGMEQEVLFGLDLKKYRPWVIVVEATIPGLPTPSFERWQPLITNEAYTMVYFDGVNRFYLANELESLRQAFTLPPNVWDDFVPAKQIAQQERIAALEAEIQQLQRTHP